MSSFGQQYINNIYGTESLRDYTHASKFFRANSLEYVPRVKFLYHVYFNLNTDPQTGLSALQQTLGAAQSKIGMLVKTFQLPQFKMATEVMNQYNRKRVIQKRIDYEPVTVVMHDDGADLIRTLWYNYFSYYYKDPIHPYNNITSTNGAAGVNSSQAAGFSYNTRDTYVNERAVNDWGYSIESCNDAKPAFFRDITVYGFNQHKWVSYVLINPMISSWSHDTYDYSQDDGVMQNTMVIQYETVKYYNGYIGAERPDINVPGFADPSVYSQSISPLSTRTQTSQVNGQGGSIQVGEGAISDLQATTTAGVIGNVQRADVEYQRIQRPPPPPDVIYNSGGKKADPPFIDSPPPVRNSSGVVDNTQNVTNQLLVKPLTNPNGLPSVPNGTPANQGLQIPTQPIRRQFNPVTGELGGQGSDLPISP
jgi:hypothetical protein